MGGKTYIGQGEVAVRGGSRFGESKPQKRRRAQEQWYGTESLEDVSARDTTYR
jgi:hypothetical protein